MDLWSMREASFTDFGDVRLTKRYGRLLGDLGAKPEGSVPQACENWAATKGAYRFWDHEQVTPQAIRRGQCERTMERIKESGGMILAIQDTTDLVYSTHPHMTGLGPLPGAKTAGKAPQGLLVHLVLAVSAQGVPPGLLHQEVWARPEPEEEPASEKPKGKKRSDDRPIEESRKLPVVDERASGARAASTQPRGGDRGRSRSRYLRPVCDEATARRGSVGARLRRSTSAGSPREVVGSGQTISHRWASDSRAGGRQWAPRAHGSSAQVEVRTLAIGEVKQQGEQSRTSALSYFSRMTDAGTFADLSSAETQQRHVLQAAQVAVVTDGAEWLQSWTDLHRPDATRILDFPHAAQRISAILEALAQAGQHMAPDALSRSLHLLKHRGPRPVLRWLDWLTREARDGGTIAEDLTYLHKREPFMQYPTYRAAGWPIGSGMVESAKLLPEEEHVLPVTSKVPMTPLETCVVEENQDGAQACRAVL